MRYYKWGYHVLTAEQADAADAAVAAVKNYEILNVLLFVVSCATLIISSLPQLVSYRRISRPRLRRFLFPILRRISSSLHDRLVL